MTTPAGTVAAGAVRGPRARGGSTLLDWLTTTDHKRIGLLYAGGSFGFMLIAGAMALAMRAELTRPGLQFVTEDAYAQLFTMHGTLMMLLFGTPLAAAFANFLVPLQVGAADMAFPRLNALSFWLFLFGGIVVLSGFATIGGAANAGWTAYPPLSDRVYAPSAGMDLWIAGLMLVGISSILGAINFITTIYAKRAHGMTMLRLPMFTWAILVTSVMILFAFPALTAALAMLFLDRHAGGAFFDPAAGGDPILWQHLFWFFGHPEVYILIIPTFGIVSEIIPVFSRKPIFGYRSMVFAFLFIAGYSMSVWAHHMFTTGVVSNPFFSIVSFLIAVPTGIKFFNWIATMWRGQLRFATPMLWAVGMLYVFLVGGITGVIVASPALDFHFQDTYYVVAHLHNVLIGGTVYGMFAGFYFWFPKATGRMLSERLGKLQFVLWTVGVTLQLLPQYQLGAEGMPRRYADYPPNPGWEMLNTVATLGAVVQALGVAVFLVAVVRAMRTRPTAPDDPWEANSLEWATSSPPPHHNFHALPPIHSERPVFDERLRRDAVRREGSAAEPGSRGRAERG